MYLLQYDDNITHGDVAMILSVGGLAQGISFFLGKWSLICIPSSDICVCVWRQNMVLYKTSYASWF